MSELINSTRKKNTAIDEEFDNFMLKVQEVTKLMGGLTSKDKEISNQTLQLVDNYLGNPNCMPEIIDETSSKVKISKTVINQKAFDEMKNETGQQQTQTPDAFMKSCEEDAKRRAEERRLAKGVSDTFKKRAIEAFNKGEFERALSLYNQALDEFRSAHLYQSRALTYLKLRLYRRTIEDCDLVLRCLSENSLKALMYKAKAHRALGEEKEVEKCVQQALANHPKSEEDIRQYMSSDDTGVGK